ncbi:MAG: phenylalanine--tRNA ligase subunit beta [Candidatus Omnitrophota bacterium]
MKISLKWIKDYVDVTVSVQRLVERLTMAGIEAEKIEKVNGDTAVEFEITPNRPDCLSMIGMAREIAASFDKPLCLPKISARTFPRKKCDIDIQTPEACSRYIGTVIEGVQVSATAPSIRPCGASLVNLRTLGSRLINNIVDITNYCLFEYGQPLHAFDLDKLEGGRIIVRYAEKGERIITLDGEEHELDPSVLVIADARKPVAIAGIMGGAETEVTAGTKNILLESAYFDPITIRRTVRKLGLASDSSYRFERGVVYDNVAAGAGRASDMILDCAGGTITRRTDVKAGKKPAKPRAITLDCAKMNIFLGAEISQSRTRKILKALGFETAAPKKNLLKVIPPGFRLDVKQAADLYEEVSRVIGYDQLPSSFPLIKNTGMRTNPQRRKRLRIIDRLLAQGFNEVLTYSMISSDQLTAADMEDVQRIKILNPLSREQEFLRPHLLPSLLQVAQTNINRGQDNLAFFEAGKVYLPGGEKEALGMIMAGCLRQDWRRPEEQPFDFYDLKGALEQAFSRETIAPLEFRKSREKLLEDGQRADIFCGKKKIGACGKVAENILSAFGIKQAEIFYAQVELATVYQLPQKKTVYKPISEYPAIVRDVSLAVSKDISYQDVCAVVEEFGSEYLQKIAFKEVYTGEKIPDDQRGLVFSVVYQSSQKTLTEDEVQKIHESVLDHIGDRLGAVIR